MTFITEKRHTNGSDYHGLPGVFTGKNSTGPCRPCPFKGTAVFLFLAAVSLFFFASCPGTESPGQEELLLPPSKPSVPLLVSWNDMIVAGWNGVSGADSYEIYCSGESGNPGPMVKTTGATGAVLTTTGEQAAFGIGNTYHVWIRAKNSAGVSPLSDSAAQIFGGAGPLYREMVAVDGKSVSGSDSYAITVTVPNNPAYTNPGSSSVKRGVFVQGRSVSIPSFAMAKHETTRELYFAVQAWALEKGYRFANIVPVLSDSDKHKPVAGINWRDAIVWCNAYSEMEGLEPVYRGSGGVLKDSSNAAACDNAVMDKTKSGYRLPTEAEREFAARGGDPGLPDWMFTYAGSNNADDVAWHHGNSPYQTNTVGAKAPNSLGIHDLSGNVQEWCWDWMNYAVTVTAATPPDGAAYSVTPPLANQKAFNGGGVGSNVAYSCVAYSWGSAPDYKDNYIGFRVLRKP
jgi:formylglycine-generating enzyme required for sulfatase activity